MAVQYCDYCNQYIDIDQECEHWTREAKCIKKLVEELEEDGKTEDEIDKILEEEL